MRKRLLFFAAAFVFALVALLPLRVAVDWLDLDRRGLSARGASGSLWLGALEGARFGAAPLGGTVARLRKLPLLLGRARLDLEAETGLEGAATVCRRSFGFADVGGTLEAGGLFAPLPVETLELGDVSVRFESGRCAAAEGSVRPRLGTSPGAPALPVEASGALRCHGPALLLPLAGRSGMEAVQLRLLADGRWLAHLIVRPPDVAARERLVAAGFRPVRGGYGLRFHGSL